MPTPDSLSPLFTGSIDEAYRYCQRLAFSHYENFPVASLFIPRDKRKHVAAIYAFARLADDYADEPGLTVEERLKKLADWRRRLEESYAGKASDPVFVALAGTCAEFRIPQDLFSSLLKAFVSDVTTRRYETFMNVLSYCRNSANPVGRLVLHVFGYRDEQLAEWSDQICTALQLTNFWQDLSIDARKDRLYVPLEDMRKFGVSVEDIAEGRYSKPFADLMEFQVLRTREMFERGKPLLRHVHRDLALEMKLTWLGGVSILERIRKMDYDVLHRRPALSRIDKGLLVARALF